MINRKKLAFIILIILQVETIIFLSLLQRKDSLSISKISINKNVVDFVATKELKHFFELDEPTKGYVEINYSEDKDINSIRYKINNDNMHEIRDYSIDKGSSTYRILALGDSFTYGLGVETNSNYTEVLEHSLKNECKKLNNYQVINLGVPGYDIRYSLERFRLRGNKYNPDLVTLYLKWDDFVTDNELMWEYLKSHGLDPYGLGNDSYTRIRSFIEEFGEYSEELQFKSLLDLIKEIDGPVLIFVDLHFSGMLRSRIESIINSVNFPIYYLNTGVNLNTDIDTKYVLPDGHPNRLGHRAISDSLFKFLTESVVPCK